MNDRPTDVRPTGEGRPEEPSPEGPPAEHEPERAGRAPDGPVFDPPIALNRESDALPGGERPDRSGTMAVIVIATVILVGAAVVLWWWYTSRGAPPNGGAGGAEPPGAAVDAVPADPAAAPEPAAAEPPSTAPAAPDLLGSDTLVRDLVRGVSRHAEWLVWLASDELVTSFVRAVGAVAYDEPPQGSLEPLRPDDGFSVVRRGQRFYPAYTSYRRFDLAVDVFESIDAAGAGRAWQQLEPLFERAHDELGYPGEFGDTLERAVTRLLATPMPESPPELRLRVISFEYVDPALEELEPAQKLLLRLGPENGDRVRTKVRELYAALELEQSRRTRR